LMGSGIVERWRFGVPGPLEASWGGVPVGLGGERQRVFWHCCWVRANELVTVEQGAARSRLEGSRVLVP
jgi:hypothetical protein